MMRSISADICVIGAGSAGLSVTAGAAQLGKRVVLCEKGKMGGDCLNYGCVPSKALIAAASAAATARSASKFGVSVGEPRTEFASVMDHVQSVIDAIAPHDSQERFEGLGVTVIREAASFIDARRIRAGETVISAKFFVIATGSSAFIPPIDGIEDVPYFINETIFSNRVLPDHLIIIGGGPIGVELAQAHRRLGARVTIVEANRILNKEDPDAAELVRKALTEEGVSVREGSAVKSVSTQGDEVEVLLAGGTIKGSHLLIAVGRRANLTGLDLQKAGVRLSKDAIELDLRLRTSNKRIYAIGDAAGGAQFTHLAGDHASTFIRNALFKMPAKRRDALCPRVTYCDPEIATIGLAEEEARKVDPGARSVQWDFKDNDRAQAEKRTEGFAKIVVGRKGKILGATIVGKAAGDHLQPLALAIANGMKIGAFTAMIAPYPTRGEVLKRAAGAWYAPTLFSDRTRSVVRLLSLFD